jgi:hypothetical protein
MRRTDPLELHSKLIPDGLAMRDGNTEGEKVEAFIKLMEGMVVWQTYCIQERLLEQTYFLHRGIVDRHRLRGYEN